MKVTYILKENPYYQSSASGNRWLTLIDGLNNLGIKIELLIYGGYLTNEEKNLWPSKGFYGDIKYEYLNQKTLEGYWKNRFHKYIGHIFSDSRILKLIIDRFENAKEIVWTDVSLFCFVFSVKVKKQNNHDLKLFLEISEFMDIHQYNKGNFLQRWVGNQSQRFFEKEAFQSYDGLALMTKTLRKYYSSFPEPKPKILHLPMTVDLERFNEQTELLPKFEKPYIVYVGVMNDAKDGVSLLIRSFKEISNKFKYHKLYLIGGWNYDTPIHKELIQELGLQDRVQWKGEFQRGLIPAIINNADLLALPRPDSKQAQGGFPTKLGEYLATGNPVCATRVGEIPNYLVDNESVFFAEPGSVSSFAEAMDRALSNPELAKTVGLNGRKVAEKEFNKEIQAKKLHDFLIQLQHDS